MSNKILLVNHGSVQRANRILEAIRLYAKTPTQLAEMENLDLSRMRAYLQALRSAGLAYVARRETATGRGRPESLWLAGQGEEPAPLTGAERSRQYNAKRPRVAVRRPRKTVVRRDALTAAFFGQP